MGANYVLLGLRFSRGEEVTNMLVEACCDPAVVFETPEGAFDDVSGSLESFVVGVLDFSIEPVAG